MSAARRRRRRNLNGIRPISGPACVSCALRDMPKRAAAAAASWPCPRIRTHIRMADEPWPVSERGIELAGNYVRARLDVTAPAHTTYRQHAQHTHTHTSLPLSILHTSHFRRFLSRITGAKNGDMMGGGTRAHTHPRTHTRALTLANHTNRESRARAQYIHHTLPNLLRLTISRTIPVSRAGRGRPGG